MSKAEDIRAQRETYRDFRNYVEQHIRDDDNPEASVIDFDLMKPPGTVSLELPLTGINRGNQASAWEKIVRDFRPGSRLELEHKSAYDDSLIYVAYIPYVDTAKKKKSKRRHRVDDDDEDPDLFRLILWVFILLVLVAICGFKVSTEEWEIVTRFIGVA